MDAAGTNVRQLTHNRGDDWAPAWTPDGQALTFLWGPANHGQVYLIGVDGSGQRLLDATLGDVSGDFDWSPDGERLLFTSIREPFDIVDSVTVAAGSYDHVEAQLVGMTDQRKWISLSMRATIRGFFGGTESRSHLP